MASIPPDSTGSNDTINRLTRILQSASNRRFVKRIVNPFNAPVAVDDENAKQVMTHKMAWGEADGKYYVYPTVMEDAETGKLKNYGKQAFDEAVKRRDFIAFDNPEEADWFSRNYKKYWDTIGYTPKGNQ